MKIDASNPPPTPNTPTSKETTSTPPNRRDTILAVAPGRIIRALIIKVPTIRAATAMTVETMINSSRWTSQVFTPLTRAISSSISV